MENFFSEHLFPCAFKSLFGIDCPVCGFQRSFLLLVEGNFTESIKMYAPLIPILILAVIAITRVLRPTWIDKKSVLFYSAFVLIIIMINYTIKLII